jgi:hypothetical protein
MTGVTRKRKQTNPLTSSTNVPAKIRKTTPQKKEQTPNKKITDFFPVRKSNRIPAKALEVCYSAFY